MSRFLLLLFCCSGTFWSASALSVECLNINLEFVVCTWNPKTSLNYTFSSSSPESPGLEACPHYLLRDAVCVGCRIPLTTSSRRVRTFHAEVYTEGNQTASKTFHSFQRYVQLKPPYNLSLERQNDSLVLSWRSSTSQGKHCIVYMVRNQEDPSQLQNVTGTSYRLPLLFQNKPYVFQVRSTMSELCGSSDFWSDWSAALELREAQESDTKHGFGQWHEISGTLLAVLLFCLGLCFCFFKRKRIVLLYNLFLVVPDPSRNLQDLFSLNDGNVENWVQISRELKEAFELDYIELYCDVREVGPSFDSTSQSKHDDVHKDPDEQITSGAIKEHQPIQIEYFKSHPMDESKK